MQAPSTVEHFLELVRRSGLVDAESLTRHVANLHTDSGPAGTPRELAQLLVRDGLLTQFQAEQLLLGKVRGFLISGKYRLLEHLGAGGMGSVFLCEHIVMRRRVALKVLPTSRARDPSYLERFYREARAVAALDHPNIVRAYDIDHDDKLHFLVMEYVDGNSLQHIVSSHGPLEVRRAAHYLRQAAEGLQHAHEAGLVHRDLKPANILVDRNGVVKILDMGLARFFYEDDSISKKYDEAVLGTADYLAPEQALDSNVDIRADIYSLGATFYFCLTGHTLFGEGHTTQKFIWHQTRQPKPIRFHRPEVPEELAALIEKKMLAKDPAQRFQLPSEIVEAVAPWTEEPIPRPPSKEMPRLCLAASRGSPSESGAAGSASPGPRPSWTVVRTGVANSPAPTPLAKATPSPVSTQRPQARKSTEQIPVAPQPPPAAQERPLARILNNKHARIALLVTGALLVGVGIGAWWAAPGPVPSPVQPPPPPAPAAVHEVPPVPVAPSAVAGVTMEKDGNLYRVRTANYEALIESDGCLAGLRVNGVEFLEKGDGASRGSFADREKWPGAAKPPDIEQFAGNVLTVKGERATARYEFGPESLAWTLTNASSEPLRFNLLLGPRVTAVMNDKGELARVPVQRDWPTTTWFAGNVKLTVQGGTSVAPWEKTHQAWCVRLKPGEERTVTLRPGTTTFAEAARLAAEPAVNRDSGKTPPPAAER